MRVWDPSIKEYFPDKLSETSKCVNNMFDIKINQQIGMYYYLETFLIHALEKCRSRGLFKTGKTVGANSLKITQQEHFRNLMWTVLASYGMAAMAKRRSHYRCQRNPKHVCRKKEQRENRDMHSKKGGSNIHTEGGGGGQRRRRGGKGRGIKNVHQTCVVEGTEAKTRSRRSWLPTSRAAFSWREQKHNRRLPKISQTMFPLQEKVMRWVHFFWPYFLWK